MIEFSEFSFAAPLYPILSKTAIMHTHMGTVIDKSMCNPLDSYMVKWPF